MFEAARRLMERVIERLMAAGRTNSAPLSGSVGKPIG